MFSQAELGKFDLFLKRIQVSGFVAHNLKKYDIPLRWKEYFSMAYDEFKAFELSKALERSEVSIDFIWEQLNTGYWKDVDVGWRVAYGIMSLLKSVVLIEMRRKMLSVENVKAALHACDMGLIMGAPIRDECGDMLANLASLLHSTAANMTPPCCSYQPDTSGALPQDNDLTAVNTMGRKPAKVLRLSRSPCSQRNVAETSCPSLMEFSDTWFKTKTPVLIRHALKHWPAVKKWSVKHIVDIAGYRTVPIEIGSKYTDETWTQKLMTVQEYVDQYFSGKTGKIAYLAQHQLFDQIENLGRDVCTPDYTAVTESDNPVDINAWFGPAGTVSPAHTDLRDNLLCQVFGKKIVRLFSPGDNKKMYPFEGMLSNTSQVDVENPDLERFPDFAHAIETYCVLESGTMLYIPAGWWHYVKGLEPSFSVSFWFS